MAEFKMKSFSFGSKTMKRVEEALEEMLNSGSNVHQIGETEHFLVRPKSAAAEKAFEEAKNHICYHVGYQNYLKEGSENLENMHIFQRIKASSILM